jgi:hypothetical protein
LAWRVEKPYIELAFRGSRGTKAGSIIIAGHETSIGLEDAF